MCRIGSFKGGFASLAKTALAMTALATAIA
jgi:hypothetical protein